MQPSHYTDYLSLKKLNITTEELYQLEVRKSPEEQHVIKFFEAEIKKILNSTNCQSNLEMSYFDKIRLHRD